MKHFYLLFIIILILIFSGCIEERSYIPIKYQEKQKSSNTLSFTINENDIKFANAIVDNKNLPK